MRLNLKAIPARTRIWLLIYALVAFFIIVIFIKDSDDFFSILNRTSLGLLLLSIIPVCFSFLVMATDWRMILSFNGIKDRTKQIYNYFFISQIVRYIPGNVWSIMARFYWHKKIDISKKIVGYSFSTEIFFMLLTSGLLSVALLYPSSLGKEMEEHMSIPLYFIAICLLITITIIVARKLLHQTLSIYQYFLIALVYILYWITFGLSFAIVAYAFDIKVNLLTLIGINTISWLIGYISFVTPSGIGVREAVMISFLGVIGINTSTGFLIALASRVIFIVGELIDVGLIYLIYKDTFSKLTHKDTSGNRH